MGDGTIDSIQNNNNSNFHSKDLLSKSKSDAECIEQNNSQIQNKKDSGPTRRRPSNEHRKKMGNNQSVSRDNQSGSISGQKSSKSASENNLLASDGNYIPTQQKITA